MGGRNEVDDDREAKDDGIHGGQVSKGQEYEKRIILDEFTKLIPDTAGGMPHTC